MNYTELVTAIKDYCQNSESTFVTHIDDFIIAAEDKVFMAIQMPAFWKQDIDQVTAADDAEYDLPAGSVDILSARVNENAGSSAGFVDKGPVRYLLRKDYDFLLEAYPGDTTSPSTTASKGIPKYYAVSSAGLSGTNPTLTVRLGPIPDAVYALTFDYYGKSSSDSITVGGTTSTWLSVTAPDVLLYGSLVQAYTFMKGEPDMVQMYEKQFVEGLGLLKNMGEARQTSDAYSQGQMKTPSA